MEFFLKDVRFSHIKIKDPFNGYILESILVYFKLNMRFDKICKEFLEYIISRCIEQFAVFS
jgi:hypothetical protein